MNTLVDVFLSDVNGYKTREAVSAAFTCLIRHKIPINEYVIGLLINILYNYEGDWHIAKQAALSLKNTEAIFIPLRQEYFETLVDVIIDALKNVKQIDIV